MVEKLRQLRGQLPLAGRIRMGKKVPSKRYPGKTEPVKLRHFRFTSQDRRSIEQVAQLYGGTPRPWEDPMAAPNQWEVESEADEISVVLPQDPLGDSWYELWAGSGCLRRCDGETCTLAKGGGPDGSEPLERSCVCEAEGVEKCKPKTRLSVILPEVRFLGLWRIDSTGKNALHELEPMVRGIQAMQLRPGFTRAVLRLEERSKMTEQGKRRFVVPTLGLDSTPEELVAGAAELAPPVQSLDVSAPTSCPGCESVFSTHWPGCPNKATDDLIEVAEVVVEPPAPIQLTEFAGTTGPFDPEMVRAWADTLTTSQQAKTLIKARISARARGEEPPGRFEEISVELLDELMGNGTP